jgi:hypothetical protein
MIGSDSKCLFIEFLSFILRLHHGLLDRELSLGIGFMLANNALTATLILKLN